MQLARAWIVVVAVVFPTGALFTHIQIERHECTAGDVGGYEGDLGQGAPDGAAHAGEVP